MPCLKRLRSWWRRRRNVGVTTRDITTTTDYFNSETGNQVSPIELTQISDAGTQTDCNMTSEASSQTPGNPTDGGATDQEKEEMRYKIALLEKFLEEKYEHSHIQNKYWETKLNEWEQEKEILVNRNQQLQKELESKIDVGVQNLQLLGCSPQPLREIDTVDSGKVSLDNFHYIRCLGAGAFGKVFLATGKLLGGPEKLYAIKTLNKRNVNKNTICEVVAEREALILTTGHPFITNMYACFQTKENIFFVMDYMSGGDLKGQLEELGAFGAKKTKFYAAEIALAVQFLHDKGILHRDLKLDNVLVGSDGHCKIADFGLSKIGLFRGCKTWTCVGTPAYMAPEILRGHPYSQGVDWWAFGVMIFEMSTGHLPFDYDDEKKEEEEEEENWDDDNTGDQLNWKILNKEVDFPEDMSLAAMSIVIKLLMKYPAQRLGSNGKFEAIRQHCFFTGIDWQALQEKRAKPPEKGPEEDCNGFNKVLKDDNIPGTINQDIFRGLSFIDYGVICEQICQHT